MAQPWSLMWCSMRSMNMGFVREDSLLSLSTQLLDEIRMTISSKIISIFYLFLVFLFLFNHDSVVNIIIAFLFTLFFFLVQ